MATADKKEIELLIESLDLSKRIQEKSGRHIVNATLLWPRVLIASRESALTADLQNGSRDFSSLPWHQRILFKEKVEHRFALHLDITESLTEQKIIRFFSQMASGLFRIAGIAAEKEIGDYTGRVAALPFSYQQKQLADAGEAEILAEGTLDLNTEELKDQMLLAIPLTTPKAIWRTIPNGREKGRPNTRKLLWSAGAQIGEARCRLHIL